MSCRSPTILQLQKDVSTVLASFDKNVQDHVDRLRSLDPLGASSPDVFISDYGALGFTFLGDVDSAVEHLRGKISAWTSWLADSAGLGYVELEEAHRYALSDPPSRPQSGEPQAPIRSSTLQYGQLSNEETEETQVLPFHRTGQEHYGLSNWNFPALQSSDPTDLGRLEISPSYDPLDTSAMPRAAPEPGFQHSVEMMQGIAAELRSDRAFTEPCVESSPGSVGLFVESSIEASPIPGVQSSAESTIEVKPTKHTGQTVLATIGIDGVLNNQSDAQLANHFPGPNLDNQPSIAVGLASDKESPGNLSLESNGEALHDDELIETRPYTDDDSHIRSINKLINIAIECVDARKLYCQNESHFRQRLSQFLPGTFVDDIVLLQLLRMITEDSRLFVVDPLHLKLNQAFPYPVFKAFSMDVNGLVLPINVNPSDQMSSRNTNHWVIAIVHLGTRTFDAFGMQNDSFHYWGSRIEALASEVSGESFKLDRRSHDLGPYTDDSCCAFLCAFALDRYLEAKLKNDGRWPTGPELRERYFRRFLIHSGVPSGLLPDHTQQMDLDVVNTPESMFESSHISDANEASCTEGRHHCLFSDLHEYSRVSGRAIGQAAEALNDAKSALGIEQKARLIQMILECRPLPVNEQSIPQLSSGSCSLKELFHEINEMKALFQSHSFQHRKLLIEIAKEFQVQLDIVTKKNEKERALKRAQSSKQAKQRAKQTTRGKSFDEPAGKGARRAELQQSLNTHAQPGQNKEVHRETAESEVIRRATGLVTRSPKSTPYWKYVKEGRVLQKLEKGVDCDILRYLPGSTIRPDETVIRFQNARRCFNVLRQNIEPIQYNTLEDDEVDFFTRWLEVLHPELGT